MVQIRVKTKFQEFRSTRLSLVIKTHPQNECTDQTLWKCQSQARIKEEGDADGLCYYIVSLKRQVTMPISALTVGLYREWEDTASTDRIGHHSQCMYTISRKVAEYIIPRVIRHFVTLRCITIFCIFLHYWDVF